MNAPESTLLIIKPDAVKAGHAGDILARVEHAGLAITALAMRRLSAAEAGEFYSIHRGRDFYTGLVEFMTSGPVVAIRLSGPGVRARLREFVGATDPAGAAPDTIRAEFGTSTRMNAVHASNPAEDVDREIRFFFPEG
jgi:nucleoside-diphosphate kinase